MLPEVKEWLEFAKMDLDAAKHLNDTFYPKPLQIICYHCQQSAEKALKAIIVAHGKPGGMPKMHDLEFLLNQMKNYVDIKDEYWDYAEALTPYGVEVRYPGGTEISEAETELGLKYAEALYMWAVEEIDKFEVPLNEDQEEN